MYMPTVTIFTPTYNRAYIISKLFDSLCKQTCLDFEWLVVDDGSSDNTESVIKSLKEKASFPVIYVKKQNEGKHIAINTGVEKASGEWFFIVDSDDYLTSDAIEKVILHCREIESDNQFAGVVGLRGDKEGKAWTSWYENSHTNKNQAIPDVIDCTYIEYRYKYKIQGDRAEVVRTNILKNHLFPKFENEKFLVESYLWLNLAKEEYKFRWFDDVIYVTEYLEDGLTQNIAAQYKKSPLGSSCVANLELSCKGISLNAKIRCCYNYYRYGFYAGLNARQLLKQCSHKILSPVGLLIALVRK